MTMARVEVGRDELAALVERAMEQASTAVAAELAGAADRLEERARRLKAAVDRLAAGLGANHPEVTALRSAAETSAALAAAARHTRARREELPTPTADTWLVFGRVFQADGDPGAALQVRAVDTAGKPVEALDPVQTNRDGDFSLTIREADLPDPRPDLLVRVEDDKGTKLAESLDPLRFQLGQAEYVQLFLPEPQRRARRTRRTARTTPERPGGRRTGGRRRRPGGAGTEPEGG
jgi:hypothetical protein